MERLLRKERGDTGQFSKTGGENGKENTGRKGGRSEEGENSKDPEVMEEQEGG